MRASKKIFHILIILMLSLLCVSCEGNIPEASDTYTETPSEAVTTEELTVPDDSSSVNETESATSEEITIEEVTTEETTTEEVTTEEVTTEETTTEEATTTEETTTEEVTTEVLTEEETTSEPEVHTHMWGAWNLSKPAECVNRGEEKRTCACGESETRYTEALGHIDGRLIIMEKSSCTLAGSGQRICSRCTAVLRTETIPATGHTPHTLIQKATCIADGSEKTVCKDCGDMLEAKEIKAIGHTAGRRVVISKLTCTNDGLEHIVCSVCTAIIRTEATSAQGHVEGRRISVNKATCTEDGEEHVICSVCTLVLRTETVKAIGHTVGPWIISAELSTDAISVRQRHCTACGYLLEEETVKSLALTEAERVSAKINAVGGSNTFTFAAMSDIHVDNVGTGYNQIPTKKSAEFAVKALSLMEKMANIKMLALLGDYTASHQGYTVSNIKSDFDYVRELFEGVGNYPVAWVRGNHEINYFAGCERPLTNKEVFDNIEANSRGMTVDPLNPEGGYGYVDFPENKIRMIFLNTSDVYGEYAFIEGKDAPSIGVSSSQMRWIASSALDFSDKTDVSEWGIIINSHVPLDYNADTRRVLELLEAYNSGKSGSLRYVQGGKGYNIEYRFSARHRAEIICSIHGHIHNFKYDKISSSSSVEPWLWRVCIPNMGALRENQYAAGTGASAEKWGDRDENGDPLYYTKCHWDSTLGTYVYDEEAATSYCMVTVDRDARAVYFFFVGTGFDRVIMY